MAEGSPNLLGKSSHGSSAMIQGDMACRFRIRTIEVAEGSADVGAAFRAMRILADNTIEHSEAEEGPVQTGWN